MTRVDVYRREQVPPSVSETIQETLERLRTLERRDVLSDVSVRTWGPSITPGIEETEHAVSTFESFQAWADRNGYSLAPAFDRCEVSSMFCAETTTRYVVPVVSIAVYHDGELRGVAPCSGEDDSYTVHDCIAALERSPTTPFADADGLSTVSTVVDAGQP